MHRMVRQGAGYACLVAGVAGCILPIIPGIPLLIGGLTLLSADSPWAARLLVKAKERLQRVRKPNAQRTKESRP